MGTTEYYINNERSGPDFWLPGSTLPVTPFSIINTDTDPLVTLVQAWLGEITPIEQWVRDNSLVLQSRTEVDILSPFGDHVMGTSLGSVDQYQGHRIACRIPEASILQYPFCGTDWRGLGPEYINLCENDLGVCDPDCCNCCSVAERVLAALKRPGSLYV